jgi:hypothetical protein
MSKIFLYIFYESVRCITNNSLERYPDRIYGKKIKKNIKLFPFSHSNSQLGKLGDHATGQHAFKGNLTILSLHLVIKAAVPKVNVLIFIIRHVRSTAGTTVASGLGSGYSKEFRTIFEFGIQE